MELNSTLACIAATVGLLANVDAIASAAKVGSVVGDVKVINGGVVKTATKDLPLNQGDRVEARSAGSSLMIVCASQATQVLEDKFVALILSSPSDTTCAIELDDGTATATTAPSENGAVVGQSSIKIGDVTAGAKSTQFGATFSGSEDGKRTPAAFVIDGTIELKGATSTTTLSSKQMLRLGQTTAYAIPEARYDRLADNYARLAIASSASASVSQPQLKAAYLNAFKEPENLSARTVLLKQQQTVDRSSALFAYNKVHSEKLYQLNTNAGPNVHQIQAYGVVNDQATPRYNGLRVDVCRVWGAECGQPAADAWCRSRKKTRAASYVIENDVGAREPSVVIGTGQICAEAFCDAFSRITCQ